MITKIEVHNWKSYINSELFIDPLTIIFGTNSSGKSNIIEAFTFLQKASFGKQLTTIVNGDVENEGIRGGTEFLFYRGDKSRKIKLVLHISSAHNELITYEYAIELNINKDNKIEVFDESLVQHWKSQKSRTYTKRIFYTASPEGDSPGISVYFSTGKKGFGKRHDFRRSYSILSQARSVKAAKNVDNIIEEVVSIINSIFVLDPVPSQMRGFSRLSDSLLSDASNIAGVLTALDEVEKDEVFRTLTRYIDKLSEKDIKGIWAEHVGKFNTDAMLYLSEAWITGEEFTIDARSVSDGTLRLLAVMTSLLTAKKGSLMIIEEIDKGLHPSRSNLLVKFLIEVGRQKGVDVMCTTHNSSLLDAFGNEMISFMSVVHRNDETGASEIILLDQIEELPRLLAKGKVGKITSMGLFEEVL